MLSFHGSFPSHFHEKYEFTITQGHFWSIRFIFRHFVAILKWIDRSLETVRIEPCTASLTLYRVTRYCSFVWQVSCLRWINMPQIWPRTTPTDPKYLQKRSYLKCLSPLPRKLLWIYMNNITNNHLKGQKLPTVSYSRHLRANYISSFWLKLLWLLNTRGSNFWSSKVCEGSSQVKHMHADSLLIKPIFSSKLNTT